MNYLASNRDTYMQKLQGIRFSSPLQPQYCIFYAAFAAALTHRSFFWTIIFWIAAKKAGISLSMLLKKELLLPLGIRKMAWVTCPQGYEMAATGLFMRAEDLCLIGALYLQDGCLDGKQLLSSNWCRMAKEKPYEFKALHENGAYGKGGMMGQMLILVPQQNRIVAWHAFERKANTKLVRFAAEYSGK